MTVQPADAVGFYRARRRDGSRHPVAVWRCEETGRVLRQDGAGAPDVEADEAWCERVLAYAEHVDEVFYWAAVDTGRWPDDPPALPPLGHNGGPPLDPAAEVAATLDAESAEVERWLAGNTVADETADSLVKAWAERIRAVETRAEEARKAEKRPHDEAAKAVQARWAPLADRARALRGRLTSVAEAYRKERQAAEAAARMEAAATSRMAPPRRKATGLRTERHAVVEDYAAALAALADNAEVRALVQTLADRAARAGAAVPGCRIVEIQKAA